MEKIEIRHYEKITEDLVDLFKLLNRDMNENSPLRIKYGEDCFHDLHDMTDAFIAYHNDKPIGCTILKFQIKGSRDCYQHLCRARIQEARALLQVF